MIAPHELFRGFFDTLSREYVQDLQDFLHDKLPRLIAVAVAAWLLSRLLNVISARVIRTAERHSTGAGHLAQVKTLTAVVRATGIGVIAVIAALYILPLLGFNLGPLLTSAGVAGVAIGLAAQTIVKDCLNGFLILVEDQYNVGDVVRLAGLSGTVETMSLRKTMVRDSDGTLYVIPNSQITTVANLTRDFSVATINVSVDFSAKPDEVMSLLKEVAMGVRSDPAYSAVYLADPTLLGVDSIKGSQVIYPVQLRTKANQQWAAMRETQRRIRIALDAHGMLPGDPLRVYNPLSPSAQPPVTGAETAAAVKPPDPTTAKPNEINPFTGEGM
ncbi:mechanosensitive ion channel family protein [Paracidobacterium acidisoli]|uniref:mechanosensitive ion channel family protein n=1 Tax=Paracidobacterium acidisoli TaxID=2303751 RepID=UPI00207A68DC|nr:mechanosensitive ion channel family protein [Paracidobacterium acidisoli]